tara:strand:- start:30372 stop:30521 length:150 start_codon:yes stop_codon:yes gene_type:complete
MLIAITVYCLGAIALATFFCWLKARRNRPVDNIFDLIWFEDAKDRHMLR